MENKDFVTFDWDDEIEQESEYTLLKPGDYDFEIVNFERGVYEGSEKIPQCKMAIVTFRCTDGKEKTNVFERYYLCGKMEWKLSELFKAVGLKKTGQKTKMQWDKLVGSTGRLKLKVEIYEGKESNKVDKFYAASEKGDGDGWD